jgi:hypothetical protein
LNAHFEILKNKKALGKFTRAFYRTDGKTCAARLWPWLKSLLRSQARGLERSARVVGCCRHVGSYLSVAVNGCVLLFDLTPRGIKSFTKTFRVRLILRDANSKRKKFRVNIFLQDAMTVTSIVVASSHHHKQKRQTKMACRFSGAPCYCCYPQLNRTLSTSNLVNA